MTPTDEPRSEILFADERNRFALSKATSRGTLRRVGRGIYTRSRDELEAVVRRNWRSIVGHAAPGAVVTDRCARRHEPDESGVLTVVHPRTRPMDLPGLRIVPRPGAGPLTGDAALPAGLWAASPERAMLENLAGAGERYLARDTVEAWIADIAAAPNGALRLNEIRARAYRLAPVLKRPRAVALLDALISAAFAAGSSTIPSAGPTELPRFRTAVPPGPGSPPRSGTPLGPAPDRRPAAVAARRPTPRRVARSSRRSSPR